MADPICPAGMVLQKPEGAVHPDEPAFCIGKTEVTQEADNKFWANRLKVKFELLIKLVSGKTERRTDPKEAPLRAEAAKQLAKPEVFEVEVRPVVTEAKPQPEGNLAGPRKPAVLRTWAEAREYCRSTYQGGDLPTKRQWENACGDKDYCTASGELNHKEAIYDVDGPADVGSTPANPRGVQDMTGNVWEWTRDGFKYKHIRGGSWSNTLITWDLRADYIKFPPHWPFVSVGFRCVAPPQYPKK